LGDDESVGAEIVKNQVFDALFLPLAVRQDPLMWLPDGAAITAAAFYGMVVQQAHALRAAGVVPGDRVAVQVAKSPAALATYGACLALGAVYVPLNPAYTASEVGYFLADAAPAVFIGDPALRDLAAGLPLLTMDAQGAGTLADAARDMPCEIAPAARSADDLAALLYTSGTTGRSKGAMLTQGNLLSNAQVLVDQWQFTDRDVLLHALPIFHTHGLFVASNVALLSGAQMIFLHGFDADQVVRLLPKATVMMGVPTFYTRLLEKPGLAAASAGIRLFVSGSAPLLAETHQAWQAETGHVILERYGMTETNMNTSNPYAGARKAGTVGRPLPGVELRIMGPDGPVATGDIGMIEVRGPNVFQGYWQMPEKTAEELRADGWFITGDLGQIDADGYLQIVGRAKDLVITGGYNVYPKEIELLLDAVPGVVETAVIGVPHPDFGEAVFAVIVGDITPEAALVAIAPGLARYKQPKGAVVVADLPRNAMGKVQKAALRAAYQGWFGG
jgi:malonyl-CoA/methylmalonyl-CoA synthetase